MPGLTISSGMPISHPPEKSLFTAAVTLSACFWTGFALLSVFAIDSQLPELGVFLAPLLIILAIIVTRLAARFRNARRAAWLRGNAVEVGPRQYPDLYARVKKARKRLAIEHTPAVFLMRGQRLPDAFALRHGKNIYLALNAELVDALTEHPGAIDFVFGYELGRLLHRKPFWRAFIFPATVLPLLGPAYERARTYAYDRYGLEACKNGADAVLALALKVCGAGRRESCNIADLAAQSAQSGEFWMSLNELISDEPWMSKRIATLRAIATDSEDLVPRHSRLATLLALLMPHIGAFSARAAARLLLIPLWAAVVVFISVAGHELFLRSGLIEFAGSLYQKSMSVLSMDSAKEKRGLTGPAGGSAATPDDDHAYARLYADLRLLGGYALKRRKKHGGIPCEIGNLFALRLNYRSKRYAFSCDEPIVYTFVERGEFEPGHAPHIRKYNWLKQTFIVNSADAG